VYDTKNEERVREGERRRMTMMTTTRTNNNDSVVISSKGRVEYEMPMAMILI
jgi:hypothetical protein